MRQVPRIVVVKLVALGDVVMASTLVEAVRNRWPDAHLTWVTGQDLAPLVSRFDGVDEVIAIDDRALLRGRPLARASALIHAWRSIGRGPWTLGIVAHTDRRYGSLLWTTRANEVRYFRNGKLPRGTRRGVWMGAEYARLVEDDAKPPAVAPRLARLREVDGATASGEGEPAGVLLAPGGARNIVHEQHLRRWPVSSWVQLARSLWESGEKVTLIGGDFDAAEGAQIEHEVPGVKNLIGRTTLEQLLGRIRTARLLITHDSGPLHLAALTRTPTVALFGPTSPQERIESGAVTVVATAAPQLACAPCYDGFRYAPCALNRCLTEVSAEQVLQLARPFLRAPQEQSG